MRRRMRRMRGGLRWVKGFRGWGDTKMHILGIESSWGGCHGVYRWQGGWNYSVKQRQSKFEG